LPMVILQFPYIPKDYHLFIQVVSIFVGLWGLTRSIKEIRTMVLDNERVLDKYNYMVERGAGLMRPYELLVVDRFWDARREWHLHSPW